jgi:hypothetical protein
MASMGECRVHLVSQTAAAFSGDAAPCGLSADTMCVIEEARLGSMSDGTNFMAQQPFTTALLALG